MSNDPRRERSTDHDPTATTSQASAADAGDDLAEFATFRRSAGNLPVVAVLVVAALFSLAVLAWVYFLR